MKTKDPAKTRWLAETLLLNVCDAPKARSGHVAPPALTCPFGTNCHYASNALAWLARRRGDAGKPYVSLAYRQLEWIVGANPFASRMLTSEGMRNLFPHSRFVGLIPGGIMNGIAGNVNDEPVLDLEYTLDWRACEYWSPHVAFYIWANSVLEGTA
jgi:hypothetical protein